MSNWNPKPLRPQDPNPLFAMNESFVVTGGETPIQRQRRLDGTPHTKGGPTRFGPGTVEPVGDAHVPLYLGKSLSTDDPSAPPPPGAQKCLNPDEVIKSFMKAQTDDDPDEPHEGASSASTPTIGKEQSTGKPGSGARAAGKKVGSAMGTVGKIARRAAGAVMSVIPTNGR